MIGRLRGELVEVSDETLILDVGGVGYIVRCGVRTLSQLPPLGSQLILQIESQTREDGTKLYGFTSRDDRRAFETLIGVQGVGPKAALAVLDVLPPAELAAAVAREDKTSVARAQGVGPKLALRIVVELKGKPLMDGGSFAPSGVAAAPVVSTPPPPSLVADAMEALMGLGIPEPSARRAVETAKARLEPEAELPDVIRAALQEIGR